MSWGGNRTGEISKKEHIKQIMRMSGITNPGVLNRLNKREVLQIKNMIESARLLAVDEYKQSH